MKKKIFVIISIITIIITILTISTSAFESGEYISFYGNGLNSSMSTIENANKPYSYIFTNMYPYFKSIDVHIPTILGLSFLERNSNVVEYIIEFQNSEIANQLGFQQNSHIDFDIIYKTDRYANIEYEIISGVGIQSIEMSRGTISGSGYGIYINNNGLQATGFPISLPDGGTDAFLIKVYGNYNWDKVKIKFKVTFYDNEIESYLNHDNSDVFNIIDGVIDFQVIATIGSIIHAIIYEQWIYSLAAVTVLGIVAYIIFNFVRTL